jgi:hypothetical protein
MLAFSYGARSASELRETRLLEKHAIAPSAASLCYARLSLEIMVAHFTKMFRIPIVT